MFTSTIKSAGLGAVAFAVLGMAVGEAAARGGGHGGGGHGGGHGHGGHSSHHHGGSRSRSHGSRHVVRHFSGGANYGLGYGLPWYGGNYGSSWYGYRAYSNDDLPPFYAQSPLPGDVSQAARPVAPNEVSFLVMTPPGAAVWINGAKSTQSGPEREFVSDDLTPGSRYTYTFRASWTDPNGQTVDQTRGVTVTGGGRHVVDFFAP